MVYQTQRDDWRNKVKNSTNLISNVFKAIIMKNKKCFVDSILEHLI